MSEKTAAAPELMQNYRTHKAQSTHAHTHAAYSTKYTTQKHAAQSVQRKAYSTKHTAQKHAAQNIQDTAHRIQQKALAKAHMKLSTHKTNAHKEAHMKQSTHETNYAHNKAHTS